MSERFTLKPATRKGIIPLLALWGGTGGGKTESALRLARGLAGPNGRLGIVDTEGRRASYYVDRIPGGFLSIDFGAPYDPESYIDAINELEKGSDVGVIDSASHCWEGPDGILDLHEQALDKMTKGSTDWKERERLNWPAWREPKMRWKPLRSRILSCKIPLVVCFRGEPKTHMEKDSNGRNTIITDLTTTPIFDKKFIFEMHVAMEVFQKDGQGGFVRFPMPYAKTSHADIRRLLPEAEKQQLSIEHGAALGAWCAQGSAPKPTGTAALKKELWALTAKHHLEDPAKLNQWLLDECYITDTEALSDLSAERLSKIITEIKAKSGTPGNP